MTEITKGAIVVGASGKKLVVDAIEGDVIYSGKLKILTSAVVRIEPPPSSSSRSKTPTPLTIGNRVEIISTGESGILTLWYPCRKKAAIELDDGTISDWVSISDLRSLETEVN